MKTYKVLAALLTYPEQELIDALPELERALDAGKLLGVKERRSLDGLLAELRNEELLDLQERYVGLFDRVRSLSLHLFEHVHGESRDRGQAMVDLRRLYARHGFALASNELPDFLPAFLEFLSALTLKEAQPLLADTAHILEAIAARLARRGSAYGAVFGALVALSGAQVDASVIDEGEIRREDDPATIDKLWQEVPAFGPGSESCGGAKQPGIAVMQFHRKRAAA
ncbi:MAG: nitrate reductase molybdenum cofactor assembly chaperone [Betaproteobacteria bacterium]|nr:nitrate reductase molybdenum cofactor assembly chaperone [Betaproteobacteria bacterium]